jgi:DNA-directed RNA polymerase specialized sigma24 family protein
VRSDRRRHAREQKAHSTHELFASSESAADWDRVRPVLDDAMRELGGADREAALLRFFERRPFADIGATFKLSEDAARMRVDRALAGLATATTTAALTTGLFMSKITATVSVIALAAIGSAVCRLENTPDA